MALVDYSDSDASESESEGRAPTKGGSARSTFQKVVDRSNPGKIKVSLPQTVMIDDSNDGPPAKRAKMGSGAFGGFNSFLPAPKRTGAAAAGELRGTKSGHLDVAVSLKTATTPGFSRESGYRSEVLVGEESRPDKLGTPDTQMKPSTSSTFQTESTQTPAANDKIIGKPLMFKPLSVKRKAAKKKQSGEDATLFKDPSQDRRPTVSKEGLSALQPKVSLFSMRAEEDGGAVSTADSDYQPLIHGLATSGMKKDKDELAEPSHGDSIVSRENTLGSGYPYPGAQSLEDVASDLRLSAAERRQLFGRQKGSKSGGTPSATNIINFNTDQEYRHNEELRASGEQVVHREVTAIAPGKHSLKQLVNAAASQKEALEESFARGKSNRAEASGRYGW